MKVVKVEILPAHDGEVVTATISVEGGKEGEGYKNTVESGTPQASQTMTLSDDEKVVIEGKVQDEMELDNDQRAARKRPLGEKAEKEKKKDEEQKKKFEKMNKDEEERLEKEMPEEAKLRKAQQKERDEKIMGKQEDQDVKRHEAPVVGGHGTATGGEDLKGEAPKQKGEPSTGPGKDSGLRHEVPTDSKTVTDHTSTTKGKK